MKLKNLLIVLILLVGFTSCKKEPNEPAQLTVSDIAGSYNGEIAYIVNGVMVPATDPAAQYTIEKISDTEVNVTFPALVPQGFPSIVSMSDNCTLVFDKATNSFSGSDTFEGTSTGFAISVEYNFTVSSEFLIMSADYSLGNVMPFPIQTYCESVK